jgi:hypothetical protein
MKKLDCDAVFEAVKSMLPQNKERRLGQPSILDGWEAVTP